MGKFDFSVKLKRKEGPRGFKLARSPTSKENRWQLVVHSPETESLGRKDLHANHQKILHNDQEHKLMPI